MYKLNEEFREQIQRELKRCQKDISDAIYEKCSELQFLLTPTTENRKVRVFLGCGKKRRYPIHLYVCDLFPESEMAISVPIHTLPENLREVEYIDQCDDQIKFFKLCLSVLQQTRLELQAIPGREKTPDSE